MKLSGKCLCGAVSYEGQGDGHFHACHCSKCRAWGGGPALGAVIGDVAVQGGENLSVFRSSDWGERVFCARCGSHVFWRMGDGSLTVAYAGALDQADALTLTLESFIEEKPACYALAGGHPRLTGAEFLATMTGEA